MKPSELASISVIALLVWGAIFIFFRWVGWIQWDWFWVVSPIFIACIIYVIIVVILYAMSGGIG